MGDYASRLEERIRHLKNDTIARNNWRKLRIEIEKRGGKWRAENGMVFELRDGAIYQYMSDHEEGVSGLVITSLDALEPYVAVLDMDLQGVPPSKRQGLLEELDAMASEDIKPPVDMVVIVEGDWLSKISLQRWGTVHWKRHLKPTKMTLESRKKMGKKFNPDLIYSGDTFEVIA